MKPFFPLIFLIIACPLIAAEAMFLNPRAELAALESLRQGGPWSPSMLRFEHPAFRLFPMLKLYLETPNGGNFSLEALHAGNIDGLLDAILISDGLSAYTPVGIRTGPEVVKRRRESVLQNRRPRRQISESEAQESDLAFTFLEQSFWWDYYRVLHEFYVLSGRKHDAAAHLAQRVKHVERKEQKLEILRAALL
ncbi:MAG: hypothetical protein HYW48_07390 [Deltaproteobacteria bacterium]|nr:hypothetical protein [Deltaproteobacteria bacterium]